MKDALIIVRRNFYQSFEDIGSLLKRHLNLLVALVVVYYVVVVFLRSVSSLDVEGITKNYALGVYLFYRKSAKDVYQLIDLSRAVFLFIAAMFSMVAWYAKKNGTTLGKATSQIKGNDILLLLGVLILSMLLDPLLFKLYESAADWKMHFVSRNWIYHLRIYVPLFMFLITLQLKVFNADVLKSGKQLLAMLFCIWLMNEFL